MENRQPALLAALATILRASLILFASLTGCSEKSTSADAGLTAPVESAAPTDYAVTLDDWHAGYRDEALQSVTTLAETLMDFLQTPDTGNRESLQQAWTTAHNAYLEVRFIVAAGELHNRIDPWPVLPGFIDSLPSYPISGIVSDITIDITADNLLVQHQITDDSEVALGFHVIEYYAFERPVADFDASAGNASRRRQLIEIVMSQLVSDVRSLVTLSRELVPSLDDAALLQLLSIRSRELARGFELTGEHSEFSEQFRENIRLQIQLLASLLGDDPGLGRQLVEIDADAAIALNKTVDEIQLILSRDKSDEPGEKLALLLSGLSHQITDLVQVPEDP